MEKSLKLNSQLVLTTGEMILKDAEVFVAITWDNAVIDEAQRIKSSQSKLYEILDDELRPKFRVSEMSE